MNPWHVLALIFRVRVLCRLIGHRDGVQVSHGYRVTYCQRCMRGRVERSQP